MSQYLKIRKPISWIYWWLREWNLQNSSISLNPHFIINLSEFIASTCTYIAFPLNLGLPYDKNFSRWNVLRGLLFDIKWIDYKLHFHQNSLRDQMVNCELYTIIPGYAHKPLWSIWEKLYNDMVKGTISFFNIEG